MKSVEYQCGRRAAAHKIILEVEYVPYTPARRCVCGNLIARISKLDVCQQCNSRLFQEMLSAPPSTYRKAGPSMNLGGRRRDLIREAWSLRYGLTRGQYHQLNTRFLNQLSMCRSEEARRLILGVKEKKHGTR